MPPHPHTRLCSRRPTRGFFLTATPNRTDDLPIGIDEIAYSITYRELFERGVIIEPTIEDPLTIDGFDWDNDEHLAIWPTTSSIAPRTISSDARRNVPRGARQAPA